MTEVADALRSIHERLDALATPDAGPLDSHALQARGYSQQEAYGLLRQHGVRLPGGRRARISREVLERIERGDL